jgi:hypothetical protein
MPRIETVATPIIIGLALSSFPRSTFGSGFSYRVSFIFAQGREQHTCRVESRSNLSNRYHAGTKEN